jgi:rod shape determining protein RodA
VVITSNLKNEKRKWTCSNDIAAMLIILLQNETGSALVFVAFALVLYREGLPGWLLLVGIAIGVLVWWLCWSNHSILLLFWLYWQGLSSLMVRRTMLLIYLTIGVVGFASVYVSSVDYVFENVLQGTSKIENKCIIRQRSGYERSGL